MVPAWDYDRFTWNDSDTLWHNGLLFVWVNALGKTEYVLVCTHCCGQPWVWHMFFGKGLWWVMPTSIKIHWIGMKHHKGFNRSCGPLSDTLSSGQYGLCFGYCFSGPLPLRSHHGQVTLRGTCFRESLVIRLYSEIGQIHLSIEAQCGTPVFLWVLPHAQTKTSYYYSSGDVLLQTDCHLATREWIPRQLQHA